jgi:hypothetical protein
MPAIEKVAALLPHEHPAVRRAAQEALLAWGAEAVPALTRAMHQARPDRRAPYAELIGAIERSSGEHWDSKADSQVGQGEYG